MRYISWKEIELAFRNVEFFLNKWREASDHMIDTMEEDEFTPEGVECEAAAFVRLTREHQKFNKLMKEYAGLS